MKKTILGPPGCGKTHTNSQMVKKFIEKGIEPSKIANVSFTKKAATESKDRVCSDWGIVDKDLPYFQTLHSMAFHTLGYNVDDVMRGSDFKKIAEAVGLDFTTQSKDAENDFDMIGYKKGDAYLNMYHLYRSKRTSLEEVFQQEGNYDLDYGELLRLIETYEDYKKKKGKIDFTDMISNFIEKGECPDIDALFVDEAQDLSSLQWKMVDVLRQNPKIQIFTGDDDQAIMGFQGADVKSFLKATEQKEVLTQSYRVPKEVWSLAQQIVTRIDGRALKEWQPRDEEGSVSYHYNLDEVPIDKGEWVVLARTNRILDRYAASLKQEGWIYSRHDHPSIPKKMYEAILTWEDLCKGKEATITSVRNLYSYMTVGEGFKKGCGPTSKAFRQFDMDQMLNINILEEQVGLQMGKEFRWHQVLGKIGLDMQNYVLNALKRGDNVKKPRIKLSTIHSMKGGECENVLLVPDISYAANKEYERDPSTEHRVFYVGVTRAKKNLHIMQPQTERYYQL